MTVKTVSKIFNVNQETVRRWIRNGELHAEMSARKSGYVIYYGDMKAFVESKPEYEKKLKAWRDVKMNKIKQSCKVALEILPTIMARQQMLQRLKEEARGSV